MEKGLLATLFDLSFDSLLTTKLVRLAYTLALLVAAVLALGFALGGFARGFMTGLVALVIGAPLIFLGCAVVARIYCELVIVLFRIQAHTAEAAELLRTGARGTQPTGASDQSSLVG